MPDQLVDRETLLKEFDLMTEDEVAVLFGVTVKSLRNRSTAKQPAFTRLGPRRLYKRQSVLEFIEERTKRR